MINALDTTFLVEYEIAGHGNHSWARTVMEQALDRGEKFALAPQVLAEFVHVVTDGKRFSKPLAAADAIAKASTWWSASEITHVYPNPQSTVLFLKWMQEFKLGRKRLLDTMLAATYAENGIRTVYSSNQGDYQIFNYFRVVSP